MNKYAYVQGNPIKLNDPFGLCPDTSESSGWMSWLHVGLDVAGFFFDGADILNSALYVAEGDYVNAAASTVAAIPAIGSAVGTGIKVVSKGATKACKAADVIKSVTKIAGMTYNVGVSATVTTNSVKAIEKNYAQTGKLFTKKNAKHAAIAAVSVFGAGHSIKSLASETKTFEKNLGENPATAKGTGKKQWEKTEILERDRWCGGNHNIPRR